MNPFDFNLSREGNNAIKSHFNITSLEELRRLEQGIINQIIMKSSAQKKPVIIKAEKHLGSTTIPVLCCAVYLPPLPNAWMPDYVQRLYGENVTLKASEGTSTVSPSIQPVLDEALEKKDKEVFKPQRKEIIDLVAKLIGEVFPVTPSQQAYLHFLAVKMEGDPVSWHDFDMMLRLSNYMDTVKVSNRSEWLSLMIIEHSGVVETKQEAIPFKRDFIKVEYVNRGKKTGRVVLPDYLIESTYKEEGNEHVKRFKEVRSLDFLLG